MLPHLDKQLSAFRSHPNAPGLPDPAWDRLASSVYEEVVGLPDAVTGRLRLSMPIPPERYVEELTSFQAWMEIARANADNPVIVRAQVLTQLYVSFVWLRDSVLEPVSEAVPDQTTTRIVCEFLATGRRRDIRNSVAHGRWCYLPDFSGIECWPSQGNPQRRFELAQSDLDCWQALSRATAIAVLLALTDAELPG